MLIARSTRSVVFFNGLTPGVRTELELLMKLKATARTLVVTGNHYHQTSDTIPLEVTAPFPYIVDWVDFGWNEVHPPMRYKAHGLIDDELGR